MVRRRLLARVAALFALALFGGAAWASSPASCRDMMPPPIPASIMPRPLATSDLVRLRDIGPNARIGPASPLMTISPDGSRAAFQLRKADPDTNQYCLAMVLVDLRRPNGAILLDKGGDLIRIESDVRGVAETPSGVPRPITPRWSPDGRWIAFLKRLGDVTSIWRSETDGSDSHALTAPTIDVNDFRFSPDGRSIVFTVRPQLKQASAALEQEGHSGYFYDTRFTPLSGPTPHVLIGESPTVSVLNLSTGKVAAASTEQAHWLEGEIAVDDTGLSRAREPDGRGARLVRLARDPLGMNLRIEVTRSSGHQFCDARDCKGKLLGLWLTDDGKRIRYLRQEGPGGGGTGVYEWDPAEALPKRLFLTTDQLTDCGSLGSRILCLDDAATAPRRIVAIDPDAHRLDVLFDPNPEFKALRLGSVERLHWKNRFGIETYGDLVLPVGYRPGRRYPLIVVQYDSRGFLRGGTGDEYPIQAFANRGYVVLSFQRPLDVGIVRAPWNIRTAQMLDQKDFADRRSVLSSLERGVRLVIARGIADPHRVGITGMSDGAATVQFALLHSRLFAVAALSNCCIDATTAILSGPAAARHFLDEGYPQAGQGGAFWRHIALGRSARRVRTPILMQLPDDEYLSGLDTYTSLREAGAPVALYVFPGEHHVKWQPAHRLAIYDRSLDWFDYWLKGERSHDPSRAPDLIRWDRLRHGAANPPERRASRIACQTNDRARLPCRAGQGS